MKIKFPNWKKCRVGAHRKWINWQMGAWITIRKEGPLHIGFKGEYLGTWDMEPECAQLKLEQMHQAALLKN